ncbi:hypothetical protein VTI74DRAFT_10090 [Chaetomium olivicolor]
MPTKNRNYYLTTSSTRDFTWFLFKPPATSKPSRITAEPSPTYRVPKSRRPKTVSTAKEPEKALMAPAETGPKNAGPWSDWYVSEDRNYSWRARQSPNETWDYQFTSGCQESPQVQVISASTSNSELSQPIPLSPGHLVASPTLSQVQDPTSPKSSWPTIITTSTGRPTENLSASSNRTLTTLPKELGDNHPFGLTSTGLAPLTATTQPFTPCGINNDDKKKRPVGPVMRLLQEGRSRKNKAKTEVTKSTVSNTAFNPGKITPAPQLRPGQHDSGGAASLTKTRLTAAQMKHAKKLNAKVKSEKDLRVDKNRRVKTWLKGVEVDTTPIPLDDDGLPIYR